MIDIEKLISDLHECLQLTPLEITPAMVERQLNQLRSPAANASRLAATKALAGLVERNVTQLLETEYTARFDNYEVLVVPLPFCHAYSKPPHQIVIGNGLIQLLTACGYWAFYCEQLPESLGTIFPLPDFPNTPARNVIPIYLFVLLYRHYQYGEPLPNLRALVSEKDRATVDRQVRDAIAGAMTFILLHEMGHHELAHHENEMIKPIDFPLSVSQDLSQYQLQEFEADDFARKALHDALQPLHIAWINMALNFHLQRETLLGQRSSSHPIAVNRLRYASDCSQGNLMSPEAYATHLARMSESFERLEKNNAALHKNEQAALIDSVDGATAKSRLQAIYQTCPTELPTLYDFLNSETHLPDWTELLSVAS